MSVSQQELLQPIERSIPSSSSMLQTMQAYIALTKPRILVMLVFTSLCAAFVAQRGLPNIGKTLAMLIGLWLSSGGSAAINMWYDRDIDAMMKRTKNRPIPLGLVEPLPAFWFGILLGVLSFIELYAFVNLLTACLSLLGYIYYAVIYTMWLKRSTPQNIVIGGGAGAMPALIGWSAVTGQLSIAPILMFLIVFLWTPPHFWALALYKNEDYTRAGIPMMPVVKGPRATKRQSVMYAVLLLLCSVALYFTGAVGAIYLIAALALGIAFLVYNVFLFFENDDEFVWAKRTFFSSLMYLPVLFTFMVLGAF
ncbi:heme o synthase [Fodinisporobacter ferrooxydans]|uniref:Protoheme IX farnesyltransferase n=1 Tax=Fodinisporobacter ferrooxydans TaxID=2901836 RepID=A0ABY4CRN7_9BACL|nr:heme o synthase [Alicyclobacillaceae bacterium MYW30-H2]